MTPDASTRQAAVDELLDLYLSWREECVALDAAYDRWRRADEDDRPAAFTAYTAQLDLEEQAAKCYERSTGSAAAEIATQLAIAA